MQAGDATGLVIRIALFRGVCPLHQNRMRFSELALGKGLTGTGHTSDLGVLGCLLLGRMGLLLGSSVA